MIPKSRGAGGALLGVQAWRFRAAFARARCGIARRLGLNVDLLDATTPTDILHPCETVAGPPCIALPGQYDRVRAGAFNIDIAKEIARLQGALHPLGPTLQHVLENVLVVDGTIYGRGRWKIFNNMLGRRQHAMPWREHDEVALRSSFVGCYFFGHWLRDDCATHLLAAQYGAPMSMPTPPWPDRADYVTLFGQPHEELGPAFVRRLILFDDIVQNAHKARRFRILRERLAQGRPPPAGHPIVYLMRGPSGAARALLNESQIVEGLERRGAVVLKPETLSATQLVDRLLGARLVISIEGSQLSHAVFTLREGGGVLAVQDPHRFFNSHMDWAHALGMRYGVVVGEPREEGFYLPLTDLLRTVDLMDAALS